MKKLLLAVTIFASWLCAGNVRGAAFTNAASITFATTTPGGIPGVSSPYPSTIAVSGLSGTISKLTVTLFNINHDRPDDIEVLLVGPTGAKFVLMSDAGGTSVSAVNANVTFDDAAGSQLTDAGPLASGTFQPTCIDFQNSINTDFPAPAPAGPYNAAAPRGVSTLASVFNGTAPNGTWSLYTVDDVANPTPINNIAGGWSLNITVGAIQSTVTTLAATPNPAFATAPGNAVTFTATVTSNGVPVGGQGTVTFKEGAATLAGPTALNASGQASFVTSSLSEGSHFVTALYSGTASLNASSGNITETVDNHTTTNGNQFCNPGSFTIADTGLPSIASVYPSHIFASGLAGTISKVTLTLSNVTHANPDDLKLLLVGPSGAQLVVMGNVGGSTAVSGLNLTLDDAAASLLPDGGTLASGTFRPSFVASSAAVFPAPAPAGPYSQPSPAGAATLASTFNGSNPNGTWSLYAIDDVSGNGGGSIGSWCLTFTTSGDAATVTTLASSANPSLVGQSVTFTATVKKASDNSAVTVGTVTFREGVTVLASGVALNGSGIATFTTSSLSEGRHVLSADYAGSPGSFNISSGSLSQTVDRLTLVSGSTFCNTGTIQVVSGQTANVYPSRINVTNLPLSFCNISVTLSNLSIDSPDDVQLLLVSPLGSNFLLISDAGGTLTPANNVTLTFRDNAASLVPDAGPMASGIFRPTDVNSTDSNFPSPAPAPPYAHPAPFGAATLNGTFTGNPNGYWNLYVMDDVLGGQPLVIAGGWCLAFSFPQTATVGGPQNVCVGGTTAGLGGNAPVSGTGAWSVVGGGTGTFSPNPNAPNATFTHASGAGPITLRWTLSEPSCTASFADVVVTVLSPPSAPVIALTPPSVCANSAGNQAGGPAATAYAWTINNGTINGATNQPTVSYTAGASGNVTLTLQVFNASGCSATTSTNVTIIAAPPIPVIALSPASVCANYPGNQATAPAAASYAWTINNGTITGPANQQTVTYIAGASGNVTLGLTVSSAAGCSAFNSSNVPIVPAPPLPPGCSFQTNYVASLVFSNAIQAITMGLAFDGTNYWSCSGNFPSGVRLGRYDASGNLIASYSPGLDFRSVFTDGNCAVLARAYNDPVIYRQISPGVFTNSGVTLTGGSLDAQSSVVFNGTGTEYIAMTGGVVSRWSLTGSYLGSVPLQGFGAVSGENLSPQNRGVAAVGNYWLTYNGNRVLSAWDTAGNRVMQSTLSGAGTAFESSYSFSYSNGKAFIVDVSNGFWRGYDVCAGAARVAVFGAPAGGAAWNADVQSKILSAGTIAQVDTFLVSSGNPVPTLADLRKYQAVLVYSDGGFNNNTNFGNVLADYVDQGGGVALATFAFWSSNAISMQGRLVTSGYLPLTTGGQTNASNLSMVKDVPSHPILSGVNSFNGGASGYHNIPIVPTNGATLVAHWSDGQPLVAAREAGLGRVVGLNFYPPSSNALSGGWLTNTDGGRLMANALLWAGKEAPAILSGPSNLTLFAGGTVSFNVAAVGTAPLTYQWRKDGVASPGATGSNFTFTATVASSGQYSVVVSNAYGAAFSSNATLTVLSSTNLAINATDSGWYDGTGLNNPGNANYLVGKLPTQVFHDWFVFDIPPLGGPVTSARLRLNTYGIVSPAGSEVFQLHEVTTPVATLTAGGSGLTNIYFDLADGPVYGARSFVPGDATRFITIALNRTLRTAVASAAGGTFALGGEIASLGTNNASEYLFGSSLGNAGDVQLLLTVGNGDLPAVGYFTDNNSISDGPLGPITNAGFAPLKIGNIATQSFAGLRILFIDESANGAPSSPLLARLPEIKDWVSAGGRLIVHDRGAGTVTPNPFLVGTPGFGTVGAGSPNLDVVDPATALVTAGPFGLITNSTLDGGCNAAHGYILASNLPPGSRALLNQQGDTNRIVSFSYPLGAGFVYYSTIPLDYYLDGGTCGNGIHTNLQFIYTPNVLTYMHSLNPPLKFLPPALGAASSLPLYIGNADNTALAPDRVGQIRVYSATNITLPFSSWNALPNPLTLSNGLLRVDGVKATNPPPTFFRAAETP